jgi:hypothetical protein
MNTKPLTLAVLTLGALLPAAGCDTQDVRADVILARPLAVGASPASGLGSWIYVYLAKDDCAAGQNDCPSYRMRIDGKLVVYEQDGDYVSINSGIQVGVIIPAGAHVIELVSPTTDAALIASPPVDMRADMLHHLAVFGPPGGLQQRWLVDDATLVPAGAVRARVVNALAGGSAIEPVRCADAQRIDCTPLAAPVAHGAVFETDAARADLEQRSIGWRVAGVAGAVFNNLLYRTSGSTPSAFSFNMPFRLASDGQCPTCGGATF